jgi:DNA-directed RNA polymerase specialized sigma subunit
MTGPGVKQHIDDAWLEYQALRSDHDRRVGVHARICLHYAPLAKYVALHLMPTLNGHDTESPTLIATAWLTLSRCVEDWPHDKEHDFRNVALKRVATAVVARISELNTAT